MMSDMMIINDWTDRADYERVVKAGPVNEIVQASERDEGGILYRVLIRIPDPTYVAHESEIWRRYVEFQGQRRYPFRHAALDQQTVADQVREWVGWKPV